MLAAAVQRRSAVKSVTKHRLLGTVLVGVAALAMSAATLGATDPPYIEQLPSVERLLADLKGSDRHDTLARQRGALEMLVRGIHLLAGPREFSSGLTPDELRLLQPYGEASDAVRDDAYSDLSNEQPRGWNPFAKSPLQAWNAQAYAYQRNPEFRDALLRRYLSDDVAAEFSAAFRQEDAVLAGEIAPGARFREPDADTLLVARTVLWLVLAAMVLGFLREWRRFGAARFDPLKLRAGFGSYRLDWATGRVTGYETWTDVEITEHKEVTTTRFGVVLDERTIGFTRREYVNERFSLVGNGGTTHGVHVVNAKIKIPEGNVATAVWASRKNGGGDYILFFDRTASATRPMSGTLAHLFKVGRMMYLPVLILAVIVGAGVAAAAGGMSQTLGLLMGLFVGFILGLALFQAIARRRARRFVARDAPRVLTAIERRELEVVPTSRAA
jgi:hypothetical protein